MQSAQEQSFIQCPYIDDLECLICSKGIECFDSYIKKKVFPELVKMGISREKLFILSDDTSDKYEIISKEFEDELFKDFERDESATSKGIYGYMLTCFYRRLTRLLVKIDYDCDYDYDYEMKKPLKSDEIES